MNKEEKVAEVIRLYHNTPVGKIRDADTILADAIDDADFEVSGIALELMDLWEESCEKEKLEQVFNLFTNLSFEEYLDRCIELTTRPAD